MAALGWREVIRSLHPRLPVIHLNYLGYDEQAHRRGPDSAFARWSLKGIDGCIERVWAAAHRARERHYDLWIYSDHGQERSLPYERLTGQSIDTAVVHAWHALADQHTSRRPWYRPKCLPRR